MCGVIVMPDDPQKPLSDPSPMPSARFKPWTGVPRRFQEATKKLSMALIIWAAVVGLVTGAIGACFRLLVEHLIVQRQLLARWVQPLPLLNWLLPTLVAGAMVYVSFWLVRRFAPDTSGSGIPQIEGALDNLLPMDWKRVLPVKFGSGVLSLGAGMVAGLEGPTIQIGGSIGQMVSHLSRISQEQTRVLIAAGAAAGLATAFNAPIAGILFVTEEVRPKFQSWIESYRAVMVAAVVATITLRIIHGQEAIVKLTHFERVPLTSLWMFGLLGIGLGIIGYGFNFCLFRTLDWFAHLRGLTYQFLGLLVGSIIGFLGWLYLPLTEGGENTIIWAFNTEPTRNVLLLVLLGRFVLTLFCYGSGANGGIFAPQLAIATLFSLSLARHLVAWFPGQMPEPAVLAIAGMGAIVAATVRAPLTAIMLTVEMTDNYLIILPMLITCLFAAMTAHLLGGEPIYSVLLQRACEQRLHLQPRDAIEN